MLQKCTITAGGFARLQEELKEKKAEMPLVSEEIARAREHGDLKENAEYHAAKDKQGMLAARIAWLEDQHTRAEVIDVAKLSGKRVVFGATVELVDAESDEESTYQIVGEYEADLENKKISFNSPLARALIGREEGEEVSVKTPSGKKYYEILSVQFV